MNANQIEQQLNSEFNDFYNKLYDGKIDIPYNLLDIFKKGVMALAPQFHKINANKLDVIAHKKITELSYGDLKDVVTIILNTPFDKIYNDFNEAMESHLKIQKFIICYNASVDEFEKKLQQKKVVLTDLTRNVHPNGGNMKIVN